MKQEDATKRVFPVTTNKVTSVSGGVPETLKLVRVTVDDRAVYERGQYPGSILMYEFGDDGELQEVSL